jgi:sulfopyruvate decarboxylase alpha subunit
LDRTDRPGHSPPVPAGTPGAAVSWARGVAAGIWASGSRHIVYVPDNPLSQILDVLDREFPRVASTVATREEEAIGIAAGLYLGGARPTVMMQSSGLGNALNGLASLLVAYQIPVLLVISMRGDPGEWNAAQVPMGRAVRPVLDALGIQHLTVDGPETAAETVRLVSSLAFSVQLPAACLLPRRLTAPTTAGRP